MLKDNIIKFLLKFKKHIIIALIIVIINVIELYILFSYIDNKSKKEIKTPEIIDNNLVNEEMPKEEVYYVDIKGSVINPGVYEVKKDNRVIDVIRLAGGLSKDADTSVLNLSKKVSDEMTIIIYTKNQIKQFKSGGVRNIISTVTKYIEKDCECPDPTANGACIDNSDNTSDNSNNTNNINSKVSINTASSSQLQTLSGIGPSKAQDIINYRNTNGPFLTIDDIKKVSGIGDSTFAKIKDYITI